MADVGTIVGAISLGIQVAQGLVSYYSAYKDRESDTAHTVKRLSHLLNVFEILRKQLQSREFRPDEQGLVGVIGRSVSDCEELVNELKREAEKFNQSSSAGFFATARTAGRRLAYPFRQSTLQKLDEDIDELVANLTLALQVLQQQGTGSIQDDIQDTKALLELVRASQLSADIGDWLKAPDASINYNDACKKKHSGTGLWFVKSPAFRTWLANPNSFLWLNGFAGCGKSVLSSTVIQHTFRNRRSNPRVGVAFFYFTFNDEAKQDTSAMLRTLILQLAGQLEDQNAVLSQLHRSYRGSTPPDQAFLDCLRQLIRRFDDVYIIVDALDESPRYRHRADVLQALEDMRGWSEPGLHLLVTSRDKQDKIFERPWIPRRTGSYIAAFVSGHLRENPRLRKWEKHHDYIKRALTSGAKGVFRWVECQLAALEVCPGSKTRLDALLGSLPWNLDKTYERMLSNIGEESAEDAKRILTLLCTAKRPLTVGELIDGIAVELGDNPEFREDSRLLNEDDIRPGFIEVDVQPGNEEASLRIAHYSIQEYLESDRIRQSGAARFSVVHLEANTEVACICLAYLTNRGLYRSWRDEEDFDRKYPLATYASKTWPEHYREGRSTEPLLHRLALRLFRDAEGAFVSCVNIYRGKGYKRDGLGDTILSPFYLASSLGLDALVRELVEDPVPVSGRDKLYGIALAAAARRGHVSTVGLLLDRGTDINYTGFEGTALHHAAGSGHIKVVEALLDRGADIEAPDYRGRSPLYTALSYGHDQVVALLLDRGAQVNSGKYYRPLIAAALGGRASVVELLLGCGADVEEAGGFGNLLEHAALRGHTDVAKLLLDRGADVNVGRHYTPLEVAALRGRESVAKLLLDRGADVNRGNAMTPLEAAVNKADLSVIKLLLNRGVDPDLGEQMSMLTVAQAGGNHAVAQLLLDRGAAFLLGSNVGLVVPVELESGKDGVVNKGM